MAIGQGFTGGLNTIGNWSGSTQPFMTNAAQDPWQQAALATAQGNLQGAQYATNVNRVNQNTPYANLSYSQSTDQFGNPVWTANQTLNPALQGAVDTSLANVASSYQTPFTGGNLPSYGINPGETYSDAIMRRLQPQLSADKESFDVKMANQGIPVGSEAYNRAYRSFSQGQNDQLTSAIVGGMNTGLQANAQQYSQNLQNYMTPLNVAAQTKALTTPNYVNPYTQAAVAGPDYLGAAGLSNQNAIANQNVSTANRANLTGGLMNLAGTAGMLYALK